MVIRIAFFAVFLGGCLEEPRLKTCGEFPVDKDPAACGSPCDIYCAELVQTCSDYIGTDDPLTTCQAACPEILQNGNFGDVTGNSLQCRIQQAVLAREEPTHCFSALFAGGDQCVQRPCDDYCALMQSHCPTMFQDTEQCLLACNFYPTGGVIDSGNSVECRLAAAQNAVNDQVTHCPAASLTSDGICGTPCEGYCNQAAITCVDHIPFITQANPVVTCLDLCRFMPEGPFDDWQNNGDSVQCRAWHAAGPAQLDPASHCAHANLYNDEHCGTTCGTWCTLCSAQLADPGACPDDCAARVAVGEALFPDPAAPVQCQ